MIVEGLKFNTDSNNVPLQVNSNDGGDAPSRLGGLFFYIGINDLPPVALNRDDFVTAVQSLRIPCAPGNYYRYPPEPQYKIATDFSRDQSMQLALGMAAMRLKQAQFNMYLADIRRFSRTQNGDFIGLGSWAMRLRFLWNVGCWWVAPLYPLIFLGDISQVVNALLISFLNGRTPGKIRNYLNSKLNMWWLVQGVPSSSSPNNPAAWDQYGVKNVGDDVLFVLNVLASKRWLATPFSWLARKLYAWFRPTYDVPYTKIDFATNTTYADGKCDRTNGATYAFSVYFMPSTGANPFDLLFSDMLKEEIR